ncbi:hypothetical protein [Nonomuraea turcica]|uniref:hypothetical protein n=1 Tax=Nonomuraea sp. G32 TaxID=3067274 RepID=UPI00273ADE69|nr:hypothetical protein [Nonomuraea sp. G32]MDP4500962.1 hypothetical protein [Nonomuraea sp. G32]
MFDYFAAHPDRHRFIAWGRLELAVGPAAEPRDDAPGPYHAAILGKIEKIRRAQQNGDLDPAWDPIDIMALVTQIAHTWIDQTELATLARHVAADATLPARRAAVIRAVTALFPPAPRPGTTP